MRYRDQGVRCPCLMDDFCAEQSNFCTEKEARRLGRGSEQGVVVVEMENVKTNSCPMEGRGQPHDISVSKTGRTANLQGVRLQKQTQATSIESTQHQHQTPKPPNLNSSNTYTHTSTHRDFNTNKRPQLNSHPHEHPTSHRY